MFFSVFLNSSFFFFFFDCDLGLQCQELFVCFFEIFTSLCGLFLSIQLTQFFPLKLFFDLPFDQLAFQLFFLESLYELKFEVFELRLNILCIFHLFVILFFQFFSQSLIVFNHFLFFQFFPLEVNLRLQLFFSLFSFFLHLLFSHHIAQQHFGVESFNHILVVVKHFRGAIQLLLSLALLESLLLCIDTSSFNLINSNYKNQLTSSSSSFLMRSYSLRSLSAQIVFDQFDTRALDLSFSSVLSA